MRRKPQLDDCVFKRLNYSFPFVNDGESIDEYYARASNKKVRKVPMTFLRSLFWEDQAEEVVQYLLRYFARCMYGWDQSQTIMFWNGSGGNGKDCLKALLENAFGCGTEGNFTGELPNDYITSKAQGSGGNAASALLAAVMIDKVRIAFLNEPTKTDEKAGAKTGSGYALDVEKTKYLTGGGKVSYRALCGAQQCSKPTFNLIVACNGIPALDRRIIALPFRFNFMSSEKLEV